MVEIERKFLVKDELKDHLKNLSGTPLKQGYLSEKGNENTIRVRLKKDRAYLTIKSKTVGFTRAEFEYEIPFNEGEALLGLCGTRIVEKTRYLIPVGEHTWEVDLFEGKHAGLLLAEIELKSEDEAFEQPTWVDQEVSTDPKYFNSNLALS